MRNKPIILVCLLSIIVSISLTGYIINAKNKKTSAIDFQTSTEYRKTLSLHRNSDEEKLTLDEEGNKVNTTDYILEEFDVYCEKVGSVSSKKRFIGKNQDFVIFLLTDSCGRYREDYENNWGKIQFKRKPDYIFYIYDCVNGDNRGYFYDYESGIIGNDKTKKLPDDQRVGLNNTIDNVFNNT